MIQEKDNAHIFVQQAGQGQAIVLLHGAGVTGMMFDPIVPSLARQHRVIVPDLRGHGRSSHLPGPYNVPHLAADVITMLDRLGLETVDVLGYSQGGAVAQYLAYRFPQRVRRLVLACTFACNTLSVREHFEAWLSPWLMRLFGPRRVMQVAIRRGALGPLDDEQAHRLEALIARMGTRQMIAVTKGIASFDSRPWLAQIEQPTLIIAGESDPAVPLAHAQMLIHGIPHARLEILTQAGHLLIWSHTNQFITLVTEFLAREPGD